MFGRTSLGDIIVRINSTDVRNMRDFYSALDGCRVGDAVLVTLAPRNAPTWPPSYSGGGGRPGGRGQRKRTVRVVLADKEKLKWNSE